MAALPVRFILCAGVLIGALMVGDSVSGLAGADSGGLSQGGGEDQISKEVNNERAAAGATTFATTGEPAAQSSTPPGSPRRPRSAFGSRRERGTPSTSNQVSERDRTLKKGSNAIVLVPVPFLEGVALPVLALPSGNGSDLAQDTARVMSTLEASISPDLPSPPQPTPAPSFRGQEEPEPVLAASGGGGYEATAFGGVTELPLLEAPVVVAPVISGVPAVVSPIPPVGAIRGALTPRITGADAAASGSNTPAVRVRDTQPESPPAGTVAQLSTQPQRLGYAEYLRTAGLPRLFGAALPGVAGILLFTLGGTAIGYRQARTGRMVRMTPAARHLP